jgi:uncharacterized Zn-binding protein involved in type VI secretion
MPNVVRIGDTCSCSDPAVSGSPDTFVNGIPVHRVGDGTGGHGSWVPNAAATGSPDVFVNGIPVVRVGDFHIGHASPTPNPFHRTPYVSGSPDTIVN